MVEKRFEKLGMPDIERFENYLPTAFNSELTLLQKVNKIIFDLMATNKLTNEMIDYLNKFIETFDGKLYTTIDDILTKWRDDGFFDDKIADKFLSTQPTIYYFPSMLTGGSGDTAIIKNRGVSVMIDAYYDTEFHSVTTPMLEKAEVTSLSYFILTHWHRDHYSGIKPLVEDGYINDKTTVILPPPSSQINQASGEAFTEYTHFLEQNNVSYRIAVEDEVIQLTPDLKITLWNVDPSKWDGITTDYNQCSIVTLIEHGNIKSLYMADAGNLVKTWLLDNKPLLGKVTLLKQGHHGIDHEFNQRFSETVMPDYVNVTLSPYDINRGMGSASNELSFYQANNAKIFNSGSSFEVISFSSDRFSMGVNTGRQTMGIGRYNFPIELIVDSNAIGYQDGSEKYPFATITSALGVIKVGKGFDYKIRIKDGTYGSLQNENNSNRVYQDLLLSDIPNSVVIQPYTSGSTKVNFNGRVIIIGCSNVNISNINFGVNNNSPISITSSNVVLSGNKLTGNTSKSYTGISVSNSKLSINNLTISNLNNGLSAINSDIVLRNTTFNNVNVARILNYCKYIEDENTVYTDVTTKLNRSLTEMSNGTGRSLIYSGSLVDGVANLTTGKTYRSDYQGFVVNYRLYGVNGEVVTQGQMVREIGVTLGNDYFINVTSDKLNECYSAQLAFRITESTITALGGMVTYRKISESLINQYASSDNVSELKNKLVITALYGLY